MFFNTDEGADVTRFQPGDPPPLFRALFVGALIQRKGVHTLLEAWHRLNLRDAELVLVGHVHQEIEPFLVKYGTGNVRVVGKTAHVEDYYRSAIVHVFPSQCEGCAKTTCEAAACGLPQITTRESGDVVIDGVNGLNVPCNDAEALCAAIEHLYRHPETPCPDASGRPGAGAGAFHLGQLPGAAAGRLSASSDTDGKVIG